jgi:hypothetical protein
MGIRELSDFSGLLAAPGDAGHFACFTPAGSTAETSDRLALP